MKKRRVLSMVICLVMMLSMMTTITFTVAGATAVNTIDLVSADYEGIVLEGSEALGTISDFSKVTIKNVETNEIVTLGGTVTGSSASNGNYSEIYAELKAGTVYELTIKNGFGGDAGTYSGADYVKYFKLNSESYTGKDGYEDKGSTINIPTHNNSTVYIRYTPYYTDGSNGSFRVIIGETDTAWNCQTGVFIPWGAGASKEVLVKDAGGNVRETLAVPSDTPWNVAKSSLQKDSAVNRDRIRVSGTWYRWTRATYNTWDGKTYGSPRWQYDDTNNYIPKEGYVVFEAATTSFMLYDYDVVTMESVVDEINLVSADYEGIVLEGSTALGSVSDFSKIAIKEVDTNKAVTLGGTVTGSSASNGNYSEIYAELKAGTVYELTVKNGFGGDAGTYTGADYTKQFKLTSEKYTGTDGYENKGSTLNIPTHNNSTVYIRYTPYYTDGSNGSFRVIIGETDTGWGHQTGAFIPWGAGASKNVSIKNANGEVKETSAVPTDLPWSVTQSSLQKGSVINRERIRVSGTWYRWTRATYNEWDGKTYGSPRWQYNDTNNYIPKEGYVVFEAANKGFMLYDYDVVTMHSIVAELHVAKYGNDNTGDGSAEYPFATIEKAKETIINYQGVPDGGITVYIHSGDYVINKTLNFTAADSGTAISPVIYKAFEDEVVNLVGSVALDTSMLTKVTDETILNRLIDENAKERLYQLPLGNNQMPDLAPYGWGTYAIINRIFLNNMPLIEARWPNDDKTGEQYYTRAEPAPSGSFDANSYNGDDQPAALKFVDNENRSAKWNIKSGDALVGGCISYLWCAQDLRIDTIDSQNKIVKTLDNSAVGQDTYTDPTERYLYFKNIFEEIDMPGESYVDRENNILYFYPIGSVENVKVEMSVLNREMIVFSGASHITFDGINMKKMSLDAIVMDSECESITIKNSEISGVSRHGVQINGKNINLEGNHIHDIGGVAVILRGGDRTTLTSSGSKVINNSIHNVNHYYPYNMTAIQVYGVGHYIAHNEIYDTIIQSIRCSDTNNLLIEYNDIYDGELLNDDGGAIYWGRNPTELGNVVRYNYFHEIGGNINGIGQQSIFVDDGNIGPAVYGNIFYQGGYPSFPYKTNGGQFNKIYHNIIIGNETAARIDTWGVGATDVDDETIPAKWWVYMTDTGEIFDEEISGYFNESRQSLLFSSIWKEYYAKTQWASVFDYFDKIKYDAAIGILNKTGLGGLFKETQFTNWIGNNIPKGYTNSIEENVLVDVSTIVDGNANVSNNLSFNSADGESLFEDYGSDFSLTADGLARIRQQIPGFEDIDFGNIGLTSQVAGTKPYAYGLTVSGVPTGGNVVTADYTFADQDGDIEGVSKVYWYVAEEENGEYTRITNGYGKNYQIPSEYEGKYLRYEVVPCDDQAIYGKTVTSTPVLVKFKVDAAITVIGSGHVEQVIESGNEVVSSGDVLSVVEGSEIILKINPESGDEFTVTQDGQPLVANTNNEITVIVQQATEITITFTQKSVVNPGFADDVTYSWFKTYNSVPTIFVYSKLNGFNTGDNNLQYGVKLWNVADTENKIFLPAYDIATKQPAVAAPDAVFAIRIYGKAIIEDQQYVVQPYIGDAEGNKVTLSFGE